MRSLRATTLTALTAGLALFTAACSSTSPSPASPTPRTTSATSPGAGSAAPTPTPAPTPLAPVPVGPPPPGFSASSTTFVSTSVGWAFGTATCGTSAACSTLLRTIDGGHSWSLLPTPSAPFAASPSGGSGVESVRFADTRNGWLFTPDLWSTHDGGATWQKQTLPGVGAGATVARLEAAGGTAQAAVIDGASSSIALETSQVGTDAWQRSPVHVELGAGPVPAPQLVVHGTAAWLIEDDRTVVAGARYGSAWTSWQPPCASSGGSASLAASSASDLIAVCDEGVYGSGPEAVHVYTSHDGGTTFQRAPGSVPVTGPATIAAAGAGTAVIAATPPDGTAHLLLTTDGGATTTSVYQAPYGVATDLGFTSPTQGVVIETSNGPGTTGFLFMTYDGGHTWSPVTFTPAR